METLRLVLAEVQCRGGDRRVLLAGHSQEAWLIGEALADPVVHAIVDRAILYGLPSPARHSYARGRDPKVRQVDDPEDPFTSPMLGTDQALQSVSELKGGSGDRSDIKQIVLAALLNPLLSAYLIGRTLLPDRYNGELDPHHYESEYSAGASFLAGSSPEQF